MTRPEALKAAEELVTRLSPVRNERGYADGAEKALSERVKAILHVADWLHAPFANDPTDPAEEQA